MKQQREGYWVVRTWEAGNVGEKTKFWVPGARPERRAHRREKQEAKKQAQNACSAERRLARELNANFQEGDWLLGLDYSPEGLDRVNRRAAGILPDLIAAAGDDADPAELELTSVWQAARKEAENCLRRVRRLLEKDGIPLKYAIITSDMDGDTGEIVRVHHHLVINREARDAFVEKWQELGHVAWSPLSRQDDYTQIAAYMIRQVRHVEDAKKYTTSRNLIQPQPKDRVALSDAELRLPKGGQLLHRSEWQPGRAQYIRYVLPENKKKRKSAGQAAPSPEAAAAPAADQPDSKPSADSTPAKKKSQAKSARKQKAPAKKASAKKKGRKKK